MTDPEELTHPPTVVRVAATTARGLVRPDHQDALVCGGWVGVRDGARWSGTCALPEGGGPLLLAVIDGMGGHEGGAAAAALAATGLASLRLPPHDGDWSPTMESLSDRIAAAGGAWATPDMGATLAALVVGDAGALVVSIGDCMVARVVDGYLGVLTVLDRAPDPRREGASVVTQSLGGPARHLDARPLRVTHGPGTTRYLLCTDGLHDHVPAATVRAILDTDRDAEAVADTLMDAALAAGAPDNVSIVVADVIPREISAVTRGQGA